MKVKDKLIVVTGAGSGIGRALVLQLLSRNAKVAAIDMNESTLQETKAIAQVQENRLSIHSVDITDQEAVEALPQIISGLHGGIDGIINNAGIIQPFVKIQDLNYKSITNVMNVNFYGTLYMVKAFLPYLLKRKEAHIMNISSMGGFLPVPGQSVYGASKAAVKLLTESLYAELLYTSVGVTIVYPGAIATNITTNSGVTVPNKMSADENTSKFKAMDAELAAKKMVVAIEKNKMWLCVGRDSSLMNLLYRISPTYATKLITKQMRTLLEG